MDVSEATGSSRPTCQCTKVAATLLYEFHELVNIPSLNQSKAIMARQVAERKGKAGVSEHFGLSLFVRHVAGQGSFRGLLQIPWRCTQTANLQGHPRGQVEQVPFRDGLADQTPERYRLLSIAVCGGDLAKPTELILRNWYGRLHPTLR